MCGIAGFNLAPDERVDARTLATELLIGIEPRGGHATGVGYHDTDGTAWIQKDPVTASTFVKDLDMPADVRNAVLHTRFATQGSKAIAENNHPIEIPGHVLGVHNGCVWNDDALFERIGADKRIAQVDSEAIFAAVAYLPGKVIESLAAVEGSAAVAWIEPSGDPAAMHVARVSTSPVIYAFTEAGSFVFASTDTALRRGFIRSGLSMVNGPFTLSDETYLKVRGGEVVAKHAIPLARRRTSVPLTAKERLALNL